MKKLLVLLWLWTFAQAGHATDEICEEAHFHNQNHTVVEFARDMMGEIITHLDAKSAVCMLGVCRVWRHDLKPAIAQKLKQQMNLLKMQIDEIDLPVYVQTDSQTYSGITILGGSGIPIFDDTFKVIGASIHQKDGTERFYDVAELKQLQELKLRLNQKSLHFDTMLESMDIQ